MDHKAFVAALPPDEKARLTERSDRAGLVHLAGHLGAIALCGALIALGVPGWWLLLPVQGVLVVFLFTLEHEATHKTPFANGRLNEAVGRACGFLLLLPFEWFRYFHLAHHRWTNIEGMDPELAGGKPETLRAWLWHVSGLPYWGAQARLVWRLARGRERADYLPAGALPRMEQEARAMLGGYALVLVSIFATPVLIWVWLLPVLLGQPALRLYLLAEHGDCPRVANMFENTRTTFTTAVMRFLAWNMPYHVEHHVYPQVPFHRLPELHGRIRDELRVTAEGYAAFTRDYLAGRRG
jgi:fatty acid desaturase